MTYSIKAISTSKVSGVATIKDSEIIFGTTADETLPNPAEVFLSSIAACILKNVERFSDLLNFEYSKAEIIINATRLEKPPRMDDIIYELTIFSQDPKIKVDLLKKNIEKFGTIYNTVKVSCAIDGEITVLSE